MPVLYDPYTKRTVHDDSFVEAIPTSDDNGDYIVRRANGKSSLVPAGIPTIPVMENQADSTATSVANLKTDFNGLLAKLKDAGLMEADEEEEET